MFVAIFCLLFNYNPCVLFFFIILICAILYVIFCSKYLSVARLRATFLLGSVALVFNRLLKSLNGEVLLHLTMGNNVVDNKSLYLQFKMKAWSSIIFKKRDIDQTFLQNGLYMHFHFKKYANI